MPGNNIGGLKRIFADKELEIDALREIAGGRPARGRQAVQAPAPGSGMGAGLPARRHRCQAHSADRSCSAEPLETAHQRSRAFDRPCFAQPGSDILRRRRALMPLTVRGCQRKLCRAAVSGTPLEDPVPVGNDGTA